MTRLLSRSATGQHISNYTSFYGGPVRPGEGRGPEEFHVVLVDNGRSRMLSGEFRPMLRCIRCGACMNHCPVYNAVGGHSYGSVYVGPMGAVITPQIVGLEEAPDLPQACTLNGRCFEVCPMKIPLPDLLRRHRRRQHREGINSTTARWALKFWRFLVLRPALYRGFFSLAVKAFKLCGRGGWVRFRARRWRLAFKPRATGSRTPPNPQQNLERPAMSGSRERILQAVRSALGRSGGEAVAPPAESIEILRPATDGDRLERFFARLRQVSMTHSFVDGAELLPAAVLAWIEEQGLPFRLAVDTTFRDRAWPDALELLPSDDSSALVGLGSALCGVAETGSLVLLSGADRPAAAHFLPDYHLVALASDRVVDHLEDAWALVPSLEDSPRAVLFNTGPSRTGDIEQTIELGAHGPRCMHLFLLPPSPSYP